MSRFLAKLVIALSASNVLAASAYSQTIVPPGQMFIDGYPFNCGNAPTILTGPQLGDVAKATPGEIYLNWPMFNSLPTGVKAFIYAHECGHVLYGPNENVADEFAIKIGRNQGWINPNILNQICQSVFFSRGDWTHLPGPPRCSMMIAYFTSP